MNTLTMNNRNGIAVIDSREVAEMVGKRHDNLLRDIDGYVAILDQTSTLRSDQFFQSDTYQSGTGKEYKLFWLTRKGCDLVANKLTGEKGVLFTATYVTRFEEMERALKTEPVQQEGWYKAPSLKEALQMMIGQLETIEKLEGEKAVLQLQLEEAAPKLSYLDRILESEDTLVVTQIAKDYGMSARKLNAILHECHVIFRVNDEWVLYAEHQGNGYTQSRTYQYQKSEGYGTSVQLRWTQKGRLFIHELLSKRGIVAFEDRCEDDEKIIKKSVNDNVAFMVH